MDNKEGLSLELHQVTRHEAGTYICVASNGVGDPAEATIRVNVECEIKIKVDFIYLLL